MSQSPSVLWIQVGLHSGLDLVVPFREHGCDITNLLLDSAELHHFTQQLPGPIYALFTLHECYSQGSGHPAMWSFSQINTHPPIYDAVGESCSTHTHHPSRASPPITPSGRKSTRFHAVGRRNDPTRCRPAEDMRMRKEASDWPRPYKVRWLMLSLRRKDHWNRGY